MQIVYKYKIPVYDATGQDFSLVIPYQGQFLKAAKEKDGQIGIWYMVEQGQQAKRFHFRLSPTIQQDPYEHLGSYSINKSDIHHIYIKKEVYD